MSTINLAKSYRAYSPQDLRELAYQGILEVNGFDMSDVFEYIFTDYNDQAQFTQEDIDSSRDEGYDSGWSEARSAAINAVENM